MEPTESNPPCNCTGIRFCASCRDSERVRLLFENSHELKDAASVIANQKSEDRSSSYSFALLRESDFSFCPGCSSAIQCDRVLKECTDHTGIVGKTVPLSGLYIQRNAIPEKLEQELITFFDHPVSPFPGWKISQSGRRKQDFGPKRNFKKKKVKPSDLPHMPLVFRELFGLVSEVTNAFTGTTMDVVEASVLEYTADRLSNFDPHVDDTWLWGDRVVGANLLEDCSMTFVNAEGIAVEAHLPRRCIFIMSGESRNVWMHGIRPENIQQRRVSVTMRELSKEILEDEETAAQIISAANSFK